MTWILPVCIASRRCSGVIRQLPSQNILQVIPESEVVDVVNVGKAPDTLPAALIHEPGQLRRHFSRRLSIGCSDKYLGRAVRPASRRGARWETALAVGAVSAVRACAALFLSVLAGDAAANFTRGEPEFGETVGGSSGTRVGIAPAADTGPAALARGTVSLGTEELAGEDVAVSHLIAQIGPFACLIRRHSSPDQVRVVR